MSIARITVPAAWGPSSARRAEVAEFKLGLGPCGLTVTKLDSQLTEGCLVITQHHSDSPAKRFVYPLWKLTGRVEAEMAE
jgi:hypothetical protein